MSGRKIEKNEVIRIDVDWLLSESATPFYRDSSWFRRIFVSLICILVAVWSWPYASKEWLKWEWQQQLAHISGQHSEDVLPILLALHELNPIRPHLRKDGPDALKLLAFVDAMNIQSEPSGVSAATTTVSQLPNMNISIPSTVAKTIMVQMPSAGAAPMEANPVIQDKPANDTQAFTMISGIDKRALESLMPLLTSSQTRIVQQAFNELVRRGMTPSHLEIAIELAQGNVEQRLTAMDKIARDPSFHDRILWLVWMAESADRNVRRRAVALLGSMTDPEAMHKLRILQSREPDSAIADQISQVLLASGTASISFR